MRSRVIGTPLRGLLLGSAVVVGLIAASVPLTSAGGEAVRAAAATNAAAAPSAWTADAARSTLEFTFEQAGAKTTGRFARFMANIDFTASDPTAGRFDVNIDLGSVDTRDKDRDTQLRAAELFNVMKFPRAQFLATHFVPKGSGFEGIGKLSLRGVSRDLPFAFTFQTLTESGQPVAYLKGTTTLKRLQFGIGQGEWKSTEWIADEVQVDFNLRLQPRAK